MGVIVGGSSNQLKGGNIGDGFIISGSNNDVCNGGYIVGGFTNEPLVLTIL